MQLESDFIEMLKAELENRMARNASYSQRAFARDLGLTSAGLSEVLSGKRGLSRESAVSLVERLSWSEAEAEHFCDLVETKHSRSPLMRRIAEQKVKERMERQNSSVQLTADAFRAVRDWYHFAILAALSLPRCTGTVASVAEVLGLPETQIDLAMGRLERLGLVRSTQGKYSCVEDAVFSPDGVPSEAIRHAQEQLMNKAISALHLQPVAERDFYSYIMPIRGSDLPEMRERVRKFILQIRDDYSNHPEVDRVVSVSNQIFNLSETSSESVPPRKK